VKTIHNETLDGTTLIAEDRLSDPEFSDVSPGDLEFRRTHDDPVVTFKPDGSVIVNPKYTTTEAARAFWDAVQACNPWRQ